MDCCCPSEARAEGGRGTTCSRTPASASLHPISSGYRNNVPGWEPAAEKFTCGTDISMFPFAAPTHRSMSAWSATALSSSTPCGPAPFESKMEVKTPMGSASLLSPVAPRSGYKTSSSSRASTGPTARHSFRRSITREESPVDGKSGEYGSAFDCSPMISVPPSPWSSSPQVPSQFPTLQSGQNSVVQQETQGYESSCLLASRCLEQDSAAISPRESSPLPRFRSHRLPCDSPRASVNYPATGRPLHYPPPHSPLLGEAMISQPDVVSGYSCSNVHTPAKQQMASSAQQLSVEDPQASSSVPKGTHTRDGEISDWALGRCPSGHRLSGSPPQNLPFSCRNISNETISEENATSRSAGEVSDLRPRLSAAASGFHQQESPNQAHSEQVLQRLVTGGKMSDPRREFSQAGVPEARRSQPPPATLPGPAFGELYRLSAPATASCSLPYEEGDDSNNILRSQTPVGGLLPVALPKNETANPLLSHTMASCNRMFSTAPGKLVSDMQLIPPRPMDYWSPNDSATENGISPFILTAVPSLQRGSDLPSAVALGVDAPTGTSAPSGLCHSLTKLPLENEIETERLMSWSGSESAVQREAGYSASMPDAASRDLYKGSTQGRALQFEVVSERGPLATTGLNRTHARNPALPLKNVASGLRDVAGQTNAGTIFSPTDASVFGIPTWMERQKSAEGHLRDRCPTPNVSAANTVLTASSDCLHSDLIRNRVREPMSSTAFGYRFTGQPWDFVGLGRYSGAQRHQNRDACSSTNKPDGVQESVASFVLSTTSASADPFGSTVFCSLKESEQDGILDGCYDSEEDKQLRRLLTPLLDSSFEQELFQMQFDFQQERQWKQRVALFIGMEAAQIARLDCRNHAPTSKSNSGANVNSPQHDLAASLDETGLLLPKLPPGDLQFGNFMHASEPAVHEQLGVDKDKRRGKHHGTNGVGGTAGERFLTEDSLQLQSDLCTVVVDTEGTKCSRQRTRKADKSTGDEGRLGSESSLCETLREEHQPDSWMHAAAPSNASQHCIACDTNSDHDTQKPCLVDSIITEEKIEPSISCVSNRCSTYMNARHYRKAICGREGLSVNNAVADSTESVDFCPALNNFSDMESRCVPLVVPPRESGYPTSTVPFDIDESGHKNSEDKKHEVDAQVIRSTDEAHAIPEVKNMENSTNGFHTAAQGKMHPGCEKVSSQADSTFAASTVYKSDREVEACRAINGCRATRITDARVEKKHREIRHSLCNSESDGFTETTPHSHLSTVIHSADHGHIGQSVNPYRWNGEHLATTGGEQHTELSHSERHRPSDASRWVKTSDEENKDESEISLHGSDRAAYLEDAECASSRDKGKCTFQEEGSEPASSARSLPLTLKQDDASIEPKVEKEVQEGAGNHKMPERTSARTLGLNVGSENKTPTSVSADQKGSEPERYPGRREEDLPHQEGDAGTSEESGQKTDTRNPPDLSVSSTVTREAKSPHAASADRNIDILPTARNSREAASPRGRMQHVKASRRTRRGFRGGRQRRSSLPIVANPKEETLQDAQCPGKPSHSPSPEYTTSRGEQKTRQGDEVGEIPEWSSENETALGVRRLVSSDSDFLGIQETEANKQAKGDEETAWRAERDRCQEAFLRASVVDDETGSVPTPGTDLELRTPCESRVVRLGIFKTSIHCTSRADTDTIQTKTRKTRIGQSAARDEPSRSSPSREAASCASNLVCRDVTEKAENEGFATTGSRNKTQVEQTESTTAHTQRAAAPCPPVASQTTATGGTLLAAACCVDGISSERTKSLGEPVETNEEKHSKNSANLGLMIGMRSITSTNVSPSLSGMDRPNSPAAWKCGQTISTERLKDEDERQIETTLTEDAKYLESKHVGTADTRSSVHAPTEDPAKIQIPDVRLPDKHPTRARGEGDTDGKHRDSGDRYGGDRNEADTGEGTKTRGEGRGTQEQWTEAGNGENRERNKVEKGYESTVYARHHMSLTTGRGLKTKSSRRSKDRQRQKPVVTSEQPTTRRENRVPESSPSTAWNSAAVKAERELQACEKQREQLKKQGAETRREGKENDQVKDDRNQRVQGEKESEMDMPLFNTKPVSHLERERITVVQGEAVKSPRRASPHNGEDTLKVVEAQSSPEREEQKRTQPEKQESEEKEADRDTSKSESEEDDEGQGAREERHADTPQNITGREKVEDAPALAASAKVTGVAEKSEADETPRSEVGTNEGEFQMKKDVRNSRETQRSEDDISADENKGKTNIKAISTPGSKTNEDPGPDFGVSGLHAEREKEQERGHSGAGSGGKTRAREADGEEDPKEVKSNQHSCLSEEDVFHPASNLLSSAVQAFWLGIAREVAPHVIPPSLLPFCLSLPSAYLTFSASLYKRKRGRETNTLPFSLFEQKRKLSRQQLQRPSRACHSLPQTEAHVPAPPSLAPCIPDCCVSRYVARETGDEGKPKQSFIFSSTDSRSFPCVPRPTFSSSFLPGPSPAVFSASSPDVAVGENRRLDHPGPADGTKSGALGVLRQEETSRRDQRAQPHETSQTVPGEGQAKTVEQKKEGKGREGQDFGRGDNDEDKVNGENAAEAEPQKERCESRVTRDTQVACDSQTVRAEEPARDGREGREEERGTKSGKPDKESGLPEQGEEDTLHEVSEERRQSRGEREESFLQMITQENREEDESHDCRQSDQALPHDAEDFSARRNSACPPSPASCSAASSSFCALSHVSPGGVSATDGHRSRHSACSAASVCDGTSRDPSQRVSLVPEVASSCPRTATSTEEAPRIRDFASSPSHFSQASHVRELETDRENPEKRKPESPCLMPPSSRLLGPQVQQDAFSESTRSMLHERGDRPETSTHQPSLADFLRLSTSDCGVHCFAFYLRGGSSATLPLVLGLRERLLVEESSCLSSFLKAQEPTESPPPPHGLENPTPDSRAEPPSGPKGDSWALSQDAGAGVQRGGGALHCLGAASDSVDENSGIRGEPDQSRQTIVNASTMQSASSENAKVVFLNDPPDTSVEYPQLHEVTKEANPDARESPPERDSGDCGFVKFAFQDEKNEEESSRSAPACTAAWAPLESQTPQGLFGRGYEGGRKRQVDSERRGEEVTQTLRDEQTRRGDTEEFKECLESTGVQRTTDDGSASDLFPSRHCSSASSCVSSASLLVSPAPLHASPPPPSSSTSAPPTASSSTGSCPPYCASTCASNSSPFPTFVVTRAPFHSSSCFLPSLPPSATPVPSSTSSTPGPPASFPASYRSSSSVQPGSFPAPYLYSTSRRSSSTQSTSAASSASFSSASVPPSLLAPAACSASHALRCGSSVSSSSSDCRASSAWQFPSARDGPPAERAGSVASAGSLFDLATHCRAGKTSAKKLHALKRDRRAGVDAAISLEESKLKRQELRRQGRRKKRRRESARSALRCCTYLGDELRRSCRAFFRRRLIDEFFARYSREEERLWLEFGLSRGRRTTGVHREGEGHLVPERETVPWASGGSSACPFSASSDSSLSVQCPAERRSASSNAFLTTTPSVAKQTKKRKAERCTDTEECCLSTPDTEEGVFSRKRTAVLDERETAAATGAPVPQIRVCDFWFCLDWTSSSSPGAADERTSAAAQTARTSEEPVLRRKRDRSAESAVADPQSRRKLRGHVRARDGRLQEERNGGEEEKLRVRQSEKGEEIRRNEEGGQGDEAGCEEVEGEGFVFANGRKEALCYGKEVLKKEEGDSKKRGDQRQICAEEDACANEAERDRGEATRQKGVGRRSQRGDKSPRGNGNQGDEAPSEVPGTCDSGEKTERLVKRSGGCNEGAKHKRAEAREEGKAAAHRPLSCAEERRDTVWKSVRVSEGKEPRVLGRQEATNRETGEGGDEANEDERRGKEPDGWDIHWTKKRSGDSKGRVQTERGEQNLKKCQEERKRCLEVTDAGDSECGSEAEREKKEKHQDMNEHAQTQRTTRRDVDGSCVTSLKVETNSSEEKKTATTERGTEHSFADLHSAQRWLAASFSSEDASEASDEAQKRERRDHPRHVEDEEEELTREIPENKASKRENDSSGCGVDLKKTDESKESDLTRGMLVSTRYQRQSKTGCCQSGFSSCDSPPPFSHMASQALDRFFAFFALAPGNSFLQAFPGEAIWHHRDETISSSDAREAEHPCGCASLRSACPSAFPSPVSSLAFLCFPVSLSEEKIHYAVPRKEETKRIRGTSNERREQRAGLWSGLIEAGCRQCEREEENGLTTRLSSAEEETSREERQTAELEEERGDGKREGEPQKEPFAENEQPSKSRHSPQKVAKELDGQSGSLDGAKHLGKGRDESTEGFRKSKPACKAENCEVRKEARRAENDKTRERDRRQEQEGMRSSAYESGITNEEIQRENDSGTSFLDTAIRQSLLWDALFSSWYDEAHIRGKDRRASADSTDDDRLTFDGPHCSSVFSLSQKVAESRRRRVRKLLCRGLEVLDRVIEAINEEKYRSATISEDASGTAGKANGAVDEGRTEEERSRENVTPGEDARCLLKTRTTEEQEATGGQAGEAKRTHDSAEEDDLGRSSEPSMEMSTGLCALESSVSAAPRSRSSRPPNDASPSTLSRRGDAQDPGTSNLSSFERPFSLSAAQFPSFSDSSLSSSAVPSSASRVSSSSPASAVSRSSLPYPFLTERMKTEEGVERLRANEVKDETEQGEGKGKDPFSPGAVRDAKSRTQSSEEGHRQNCLHFPKLESGKCDDSSLSKLTGPSVTLSDSSVTLSHSVSTPVPSAPQSFTCILEPLPKETETGCPLYRAEPSPTVFHSAKNLSCRSPSHVASFLSLTKASVSPKTEANLAFASISCESHCESDAEALRPSSDHQYIPSQPQCCSSGSYSSGLANNSPLSIHSVRAHPPPSSCKTETYAFCVEAGPANKLCRRHVLRQERDFETPASPSFQQQGMSDSEKQTRHERGEKESNGKSEKSEAAAGEEGTDRGKCLAESSGYEAGGGKKCGEGGTERQGKETRTGGGWEEGICQ